MNLGIRDALLGSLLIAALLMKPVPHSSPVKSPAPTGQIAMEERMRADVRMLAETIGPRHPGRMDKLEAAASYVESQFKAAGYAAESHPFVASGQTLRNLVAVRPGTGPALVIGAHYDSVATSPGADDNASGVALLLELARQANEWPKSLQGRPVYFVAFANEEAPAINDMGSFHYVQEFADHPEKISSMISLEMVGYYTDEPYSQHYPRPLNAFYPSRGNFVALVSNISSRHLLASFRRPLRDAGAIPVSAAVLPAFIGGIDRSDHVNFWNAGYPAMMISDTAFYRNPHYHQPTDTADRLDYVRLAKLAESLQQTLKTVLLSSQ